MRYDRRRGILSGAPADHLGAEADILSGPKLALANHPVYRRSLLRSSSPTFETILGITAPRMSFFKWGCTGS
jgi:hypothetical protein